VIFEAEELQEGSPTAVVNQQLSTDFTNLNVRSTAISASPTFSSTVTVPLQHTSLVSPAVGSQTTAIINTVQQSSTISLPGPPQRGPTVSTPIAHLMHNQSLTASSTQFVSQPHITSNNSGLSEIYTDVKLLCSLLQ
jgi:hypothetical protein